MIDANQPTSGEVVKQDTPARITTSMIIQDLDNGIDRNGIRDKYALQAWEVKQMFEHPTLKGKKAKKVRKLSFEFVDDTVEEVNTNQVTLDQAIEREETLAAGESKLERHSFDFDNDTEITQF
jgi:hypothetical protein